MATLKESLSADLSGYVPVVKLPNAMPPIDNDLQPRMNPFVRCPIPPVSVSPDSLRQFYLGGKIPQMRLMTPPDTVTNPGGTVIQTTTVVSSSTSSSSSSTASLTAKQASITSPVLNPNISFPSSMLLAAKSFQLLSISANSPCRIQLYGTAIAQATDSGRGMDLAPPAGVFQNIISDVVLDTAPYTWTYQNRGGANGDSPQKTLLYITITNIDATSDTITVTINYVPMES